MSEGQYIPGEFKCSICDFVLIKSVINPETGEVGRAVADTIEACPNGDGGKLRPVAWIDALNEARTTAMRFAGEKVKLALAVKNLLMHCLRHDRREKAGLPTNPGFREHAIRMAKDVGVELSILRDDAPPR